MARRSFFSSFRRFPLRELFCHNSSVSGAFKSERPGGVRNVCREGISWETTASSPSSTWRRTASRERRPSPPRRSSSPRRGGSWTFQPFLSLGRRPDHRTERVHGLPSRIAHFREEERYPSISWRTGKASPRSRAMEPGGNRRPHLFDLSFLPREPAGKKWLIIRRTHRLTKSPEYGPGGRSVLRLSGQSHRRKRLLEPLPRRRRKNSIGPALRHYGLSDCFELYGSSESV